MPPMAISLSGGILTGFAGFGGAILIWVVTGGWASGGDCWLAGFWTGASGFADSGFAGCGLADSVAGAGAEARAAGVRPSSEEASACWARARPGAVRMDAARRNQQVGGRRKVCRDKRNLPS